MNFCSSIFRQLSATVIVFGGGGLLFAAGAHEDAVGETIYELDELSVNASLEGYAAHSVSIGRREQALREIPQSITVLTRQRLDDQNIHSLEQAMQFTPGVTIQPAGAGVLYDFYARGFPIKNVSFDSVQALPGGGGFDSQPDTAILERMEVLRGADGLFTGSGQPGGTVNLVRKRPLKRQQIAASFALGS